MGAAASLYHHTRFVNALIRDDVEAVTRQLGEITFAVNAESCEASRCDAPRAALWLPPLLQLMRRERALSRSRRAVVNAMTPLQLACSEGSDAMVRAMVAHPRVDVLARASAGDDALAMAVGRDRPHTLAALLTAPAFAGDAIEPAGEFVALVIEGHGEALPRSVEHFGG